jgi:PAS domain S-box-containing protein
MEHESGEDRDTAKYGVLYRAVYTPGSDARTVPGHAFMAWKISQQFPGREQEVIMTGFRVFIVEDEAIVANDLADVLRGLGYHVTGIAESGETAIEKILETLPDVVLMDIRLAGKMDGVQTAEELHKKSTIPVIYLTAYADNALIDRAKLTEPYGYIIKPYNERDLRTSIEIALYRNEMQKKLAESEARYRGFVETFLGIAFRLRDDFSPVFYHGAVEQITGYSEIELKAGTPSWNAIVHPDDLSVFARKNEKIQSIPTAPCEREYRIIRKDGQTRWVYELIQYIPATTERDSFFQGTLYDVSERKWAEEALLAYITEMAVRIKQPVEIISDNLRELVQLINEKKLTSEEISIVLKGQIRNATQIAANVQEFQRAIAEKDKEIPKAYRKFLEEQGSSTRR